MHRLYMAVLTLAVLLSVPVYGLTFVENLTVSLSTSVYFTAIDDSDVKIGPGIYRVEQGNLKLVHDDTRMANQFTHCR